jgi:hypothetical protein
LRIEDGFEGDITAGKTGNGYLIDHTQHVRLIYKLMLSKSPIRLTCPHFEARIALLSPRRFATVGSSFATVSPNGVLSIAPLANAKQIAALG